MKKCIGIAVKESTKSSPLTKDVLGSQENNVATLRNASLVVHEKTTQGK